MEPQPAPCSLPRGRYPRAPFCLPWVFLYHERPHGPPALTFIGNPAVLRRPVAVRLRSGRGFMVALPAPPPPEGYDGASLVRSRVRFLAKGNPLSGDLACRAQVPLRGLRNHIFNSPTLDVPIIAHPVSLRNSTP